MGRILGLALRAPQDPAILQLHPAHLAQVRNLPGAIAAVAGGGVPGGALVLVPGVALVSAAAATHDDLAGALALGAGHSATAIS
jgi:hypothetical protein